MLVDVFRTTYGYSDWAMHKMFDAADHLSAGQLVAPAGANQESVRDALLHVSSTQRSWLLWWNKTMPLEEAYRARLDPAQFPDVATLRKAWQEVNQQTQTFIAGLSDADLRQVYTPTTPDGREWQLPLWKMMLHVANHGTQHRSEAAAMLTAFGHSPGNLDLLWYPG